MTRLEFIVIAVITLTMVAVVVSAVASGGVKDLREACYSTNDSNSIECMEYREVLD